MRTDVKIILAIGLALACGVAFYMVANSSSPESPDNGNQGGPQEPGDGKNDGSLATGSPGVGIDLFPPTPIDVLPPDPGGADPGGADPGGADPGAGEAIGPGDGGLVVDGGPVIDDPVVIPDPIGPVDVEPIDTALDPGDGGSSPGPIDISVTETVPYPDSPDVVPVDPGGAVTGVGRTHVIKDGDQLWNVAEMYYGSGKHWQFLVASNPGLNPTALVIGKTIKIPPLAATDGGGSTPGVVTPAPLTLAGEKVYSVKDGDSGMWGISKSQYGDGKYFPAIAARNPGVNPAKLKIGQKLIIPSLEQAQAFLAGGSGPGSGTPGGSGILSVGGSTPPVTPDPIMAAGEKIYTVKDGDSGMWGISKSQYGDGKYFPAIAARNPSINPAKLKIGQKVIIPSAEQAQAFLAGSSPRTPAPIAPVGIGPVTPAPRVIPPVIPRVIPTRPAPAPAPAPTGGDDEPDFS
jgi:nucleoid-associated protein YgaU